MKILSVIFLIAGLMSCVNTGKIKTDDLDKLEDISKEEKLRLIGQLQPQFEYLSSNDNWEEETMDVFHFNDLDNDKDLDVIFTGWSGAEPLCVRILKNQNGKYEVVFDAYEEMTNIEFENNKLTGISIHDPGCCASYIKFDEVYTFNVTKDDFKYNLDNRTALIDNTEEPEDRLENPIRFEVLNDKYYLRLTPEIDTVTRVYADLEAGNVIAVFKKGTKGIAYAQKADNTGRVWWFVEIPPQYKPLETVFYDIDEKPTHLFGWMSSNYLKKL